MSLWKKKTTVIDKAAWERMVARSHMDMELLEEEMKRTAKRVKVSCEVQKKLEVEMPVIHFGDEEEKKQETQEMVVELDENEVIEILAEAEETKYSQELEKSEKIEEIEEVEDSEKMEEIQDVDRIAEAEEIAESVITIDEVDIADWIDEE